MSAHFAPTHKQEMFLSAVRKWEECGYGGARNGAKTVCGAWIGVEEMSLKYPGNAGLVVRYDMLDLQRTTMLEFDRFLTRYHPEMKEGVHFKWRRSPPFTLELLAGVGANGQPIWSTIWFSDAKDPASWQSANLGWFWGDEATEIPEVFVESIRGALGRHLLPNGTRPPKRLFWSSNPGPGWCKNQFPVGKVPGRIEKVMEDEHGNDFVINRAFIPAFPKDNPHKPPGWEAELRSNNSETWCRRYLEGDWDAFEGQCFPEFDEDAHTFDFAIDLPGTYWIHLIVLDWGFRVPTACLRVSIDDERHFWVTKEYRASGRTPKQHEPYIRELALGLNIKCWTMDYAALDQSSGIQIMHQFCDLGLPFGPCKKNKNGADGSVFFLKQLLTERRVHIHKSCAGLITEIKEAMWEPQSIIQAEKSSPKDRMKDVNDHSIDAFFMGLEWYRNKPAKPDPEKIQEMEEARRERKEWRDERETEIFGGNVKHRDLAGKAIKNESDGNPWLL